MTGFNALSAAPVMTASEPVELLAQAVQLIEGIEVQLRQQLVASDQQLELGDANQDLLLHDIGLEVEHLGEAGIPVGLEPGLGGRGDRNDAPVVRRRQAEDVAQLPFGRDHVGRPRHQVEVELFQALGGLGDVGDGAATDLQLGLLAIQDLLGQADGPIGAPELHVRLGQVPVLLLDRPAVSHDLGLEPPDGGIGVEPGDHDRSTVGLEAHRPAGAWPGSGALPSKGWVNVSCTLVV